MDTQKVLGSATYQGIPCLSAAFSLSPGMTPDTGHVRILVRDPEKMKLVTVRPMFSRDRQFDAPKAAFSYYKGSSMIDGASLTIYSAGLLQITSQNGEVSYHNVWTSDEGVAEESAFLDTDGETRISVVRIEIADERMWWARRGFVFGCFNKTGVDGKHIKATGKGDNGEPFTLADLLEIGLQNTPSQNPLGEIVASAVLSDFQPKDKEPRFTSAVDFMQDVVEELRLMPCKQIDGVVDFYSAGEGQDPKKQFIPKQFVIHDLVTRGHDYTPDAWMLYAQHPTVEEVEINFDGASTMVLPDPRDGQMRPAYEMLKYYNLPVEIFEALPCWKIKKQMSEVSRLLKPYIKTLPVGAAKNGGDYIPSIFGRQPKNFQKREALRRANLVIQYAFKAFMLPRDKMHLLPFEESLLSTDKDPNDPTGFGEPRSVTCRVQSYSTRNQREEVDEDNHWGLSRDYWLNWGEPIELQASEGAFRLQSKTGLLLFTEPVGKIYRRNPDGTITEIPDETPTTAAGTSGSFGQPLEVFSLHPPKMISLLVAHQLRGTRDLRSAPGRRAKFPRNVAEIQLQERASPEDHYITGYDRDGRTLPRLDQIEELFPEVRQMVGARKMRTLKIGANTGADEELDKQAERIIRPLLSAVDGSTSRRIRGYGIYTPKVDGVVTQVRWEVSEEGVATTEILIGSLRRKLRPGMMSFADRQPSTLREGSSSPTNRNVMPGL